MSKQQVQQQFGANAAAYATSEVHAKGASLARLVELVQPQADWQVLDIATAAGHTAFIFAPHVAHVTASDLTPEMLTVAANLAQERGIPNVSFREADAEALPFANASFDLVTCRIAPHHFPNVAQFLAEAARVLRPGGTLAVVDNVVPGSKLHGKKGRLLREAGEYVNAFEKLRDPSHHRCLSLDEWEDGFRKAGFTLHHSETAFKAMTFGPWADRMQVSPDNKTRLKAMLVQAPTAVSEFLTPQFSEDRITFRLTEAILVGKLESKKWDAD
ncbi:MAG: methyltransferase domain-containing protein [Anaerolineales bacterium]|nr:methyltransferase domain-containing protein [Anaerolineales bacterium]